MKGKSGILREEFGGENSKKEYLRERNKEHKGEIRERSSIHFCLLPTAEA